MKQREPRKRIVSRARMLTDSRWSDVVIHDVSSHGLGLRSPAAPQKGDTIEVRHRHHKMVGRVVWSDGEHFGLLLRDAIVVEDLVHTIAQAAQEGDRRAERRHSDRLGSPDQARFALISTAERSRALGRLFSFLAVIAIGGTAAATAAEVTGSVLSTAMQKVSVGLTLQHQGASPPPVE